MSIFYDPDSHGFFDSNPGTDNAVKISDEFYQQLLDAQSEGKRIVPGKKGLPEIADPLPPSEEELAAAERTWRDEQLLLADNEIRKHEDGDANVTGATQDWRNYRLALRSWPQSPDFPNADKRPVFEIAPQPDDQADTADQ